MSVFSLCLNQSERIILVFFIVFTFTTNHILIVFGLFEAVDQSKLHIQYDVSCCTTLMPRTINMIFCATLNTQKRLQEIESEERKKEKCINELLNVFL